MIPLWFRPWMAWLLLVLGLVATNRLTYAAWQKEKAHGVALGLEVQRYRDAVAQQNDAVDQLRRKGEALQARLQTAEARGERIRTLTETRIKEILVAPVPTGCDDALRWGVGQVKAVAAQWGAPSTEGPRP